MIVYDDHMGTNEQYELVSFTLKKGETGVGINGHITCINAFDFEKKWLSRRSIGGVIDLRGNISEAVRKYNEITIDSSKIIAWELLG